MIGVIVGSRKVGINPDNVATPIAASLGDLITLSLLAGVSSTLYEYIGEEAKDSQCSHCGRPIRPLPQSLRETAAHTQSHAYRLFGVAS